VCGGGSRYEQPLNKRDHTGNKCLHIRVLSLLHDHLSRNERKSINLPSIAFQARGFLTRYTVMLTVCGVVKGVFILIISIFLAICLVIKVSEKQVTLFTIIMANQSFVNLLFKYDTLYLRFR